MNPTIGRQEVRVRTHPLGLQLVKAGPRATPKSGQGGEFYFIFLKIDVFIWGEAQREREKEADSPLNMEPEVGLDLTIPRS